MAAPQDRPSPESSPSPRSLSPRPASSGNHSASPPPALVLRPPSRSGSPRVKFSIASSGKITRRMSSPPPPPSHPPSFDTRVSFFLQPGEYESPSFGRSFTYEGYTPRNRARAYLCGTDTSDYATYALEYTIKNLMDDGDKLICVRVVEKDSPQGKSIMADHSKYEKIVQALLDQLKQMLRANGGPAISVKIDTVIGSVGRLLIEDMVRLHDPMSIVVGTKGEKGAKRQLSAKKSVSEYLYKYSPVPLIIVRVPAKRKKYLQQRQDDRSRERYSTPLRERSVDGRGQGIPLPAPEASPEESRKVREAMNLASADIDQMRYWLNNKISKRHAKRLSVDDAEAEMSNASDEFEDTLSTPGSRAASPDPQLKSQFSPPDDKSVQDDEEALARPSEDTIEDEDFGAALTKTTSRGSVLKSGWGIQSERHFDEMPNYDERVPKLMDKLEQGSGSAKFEAVVGRRPSIKWKDQEIAKNRDERSKQAEQGKAEHDSTDSKAMLQPREVIEPEDPASTEVTARMDSLDIKAEASALRKESPGSAEQATSQAVESEKVTPSTPEIHEP